MKFAKTDKYMQAIAKTVDWLVSHQQPDGSFESAAILQSYYNAPNFLGKVGRFQEAMLLADWVKSAFLRSDGDFRGNPDSRSPAQKKYRHLYMNGWLVSGFQRLGRFDLSMPGLRYILRFQDAQSGGFFASASEDYKPKRGMKELSSACSSGLAALYCGKVSEATKAGDFICRALEAQPNLDRVLYTTFDAHGKPITDFAESETPHCAVWTERKWQSYWFIGFAMRFLGSLFLATEAEKYLETCKRLFDLFERCNEDRYRAYASGKVAWGTSIIYKATGEERYGRAIERIADFLVETQTEEGCWYNYPYFKSLDEQPLAVTYELNIELAYLLAEILST